MCEKDCSEVGCFNKNCAMFSHYDGCWECSELESCTGGIFKDGNMSKIKAFSLFIQRYGKDKFIKNIIRNEKNGLSVEKGKDYDNKNIAEVFQVIEEGKIKY